MGKRMKYPEAIRTGERIKLKRIENGLSMEELGAKLTPKAGKGAVSNWENGYNLPTPSRLKQLAEILNVTELFLLEGRKDLAGNPLPIPDLAFFNFNFVKNKLIIPKNGETLFIYTAIKLNCKDRVFACLVRTTCIINNNCLTESYTEDCCNTYDINKFYLSDENFFKSLPIKDSKYIININSYFHAKKEVTDNVISDFLNNLMNSISNILNSKSYEISPNCQSYFIDWNNKFIK